MAAPTRSSSSLPRSPSSSSPAPGAAASAATSPGGRPSRPWRSPPTTSPASSSSPRRSQPRPQRLERAAAKLAGSDNGEEHGKRATDPIPLAVPLALALGSLALLLFLGTREERSSAGIAAAVGGIALALPLALALLGSDYVDGRNLLPVFVPLLILLGTGFGVRRTGWWGLGLAAAFCLCSLLFTLEIDRLPRLQREDLRNAAAQVGELEPGEVVVTDRYAAGWPLRYYLGAHPASKLPPLREIDLVGSGSAAAANARRILPPACRRPSAGSKRSRSPTTSL